MICKSIETLHSPVSFSRNDGCYPMQSSAEHWNDIHRLERKSGREVQQFSFSRVHWLMRSDHSRVLGLRSERRNVSPPRLRKLRIENKSETGFNSWFMQIKAEGIDDAARSIKSIIVVRNHRGKYGTTSIATPSHFIQKAIAFKSLLE